MRTKYGTLDVSKMWINLENKESKKDNHQRENIAIYEVRLRKLKLPLLTYGQVRGDMIYVYKFIPVKYDINFSVKLQLHSCRGSLSGVDTGILCCEFFVKISAE